MIVEFRGFACAFHNLLLQEVDTIPGANTSAVLHGLELQMKVSGVGVLGCKGTVVVDLARIELNLCKP